MSKTARWWVNRPEERFWLESTDREDLGTDLRAPNQDRSGTENWRYTLFKEASVGDVILHYWTPAQAIVGWSQVDGPCIDAPIVWAARGTYARDMGAKPEEKAGYRIPLSNFKKFAAPLSLAQIQSYKPELITLINQMHASNIGCSLYFPFEVSMRPVRPLQGYAFKLPKAFIEIFGELSQCMNIFTPHTKNMELQTTDFKVGCQYSRKEVCDWIGVPPEGAWATGYASYDNDWFVFANIGVAGRTGHDYPNQFDANGNLDWYAKGPARRHHPSTQALLSKIARVFIFYRHQDRDPWTFGGIGRPLEVTQGPPVKVKWSLRDPEETAISLPEEIPEDETGTIPEGAKKTIQVNVYERDREAREKCLRHWGTICQVCAFDFTKVYGDLGRGFIHVHHTKPLGEMGGQYDLDPITDLRPVCPNCHAMIHRVRPALTIEELRSRLQT